MSGNDTIGNLLKDSFELWKRGWFSYCVLCFVMFCPLVIFDAIKINIIFQYISLIGLIYHFLVFSILQVAILHLVIMFARQQRSDIQEAIDVISAKNKEVIPAIFYVGGKILLGSLLVIPGIMWVYQYLFVVQELLFGAQSTREAMENSARLTKGYKFKMFAIHFVFLLIGALLVGILGLTFGPIITPSFSISHAIIFFTIQYLFTSVISSFSLIFFALLYLRRREAVYGQALQTSLKALISSLSNSKSNSVHHLIAKYKEIHQDLSSTKQRKTELIIRD